MELLEIEIINPKAKLLINDLEKMDLIKIKRKNEESEFEQITTKFRKKASANQISLEEITKEVELVRTSRYADK